MIVSHYDCININYYLQAASRHRCSYLVSPYNVMSNYIGRICTQLANVNECASNPCFATPTVSCLLVLCLYTS